MERTIDVITTVNEWYWYLPLTILVLSGIVYTIWSKGAQIRLFGEMVRVIKEPSLVMENGRKGLSSFQAFTISAAARVGTGNVAGVAIAITLGGPGAVFWMWMLALIGAATSFVESTLGQLYKFKDRDSYRGGPAYYISRGLGKRWPAVLFAVVTIITYGLVFNTVQANTIADSISNSVGNTEPLFLAGIGVAVAALLALVIFGGVRRIAHVTQVLVPVLALSYVGLGLVVVALNIPEVPGMVWLIIENAFGFREVVAGGLGAALLHGMQRGLYSNEAGMGSIPNVSATAAVSHPAKQGLVQSLGVYFDTLLICSMTAFIILLAEPDFGEREGATLTQHALSVQFGDWAIHFLTVVIFILAFSSLLGNYYIGYANLEFLTRSPRALLWFRLAIIGCAFLGSIAALDLVWEMANLTMGIMVLINLLAIAPLAVITFRLLDHYVAQRKQGLDPTFAVAEMPELKGVECWGHENESEPTRAQ
ncbi:alanine/glycine:cation symporter family protein [Hoyosella subflava]|uniref:AGCS family alanine/glycine:sodium (Na+) symporter n=1 Tax=Hoyosella subflava (strain DSM 45089 / JCM 17490 / NBRC 109087 / DQS3-9A1) TaxID=443218 RepID=F6EJU2_HOYSD|nr:alanine/glycine:cation symporter family protein [Hoyosella subflava]AEF40117.1 AGCS family alanine/glycine:sodium (Na+) symporter [Hoyosella subflava DQS3-9A1]